MIAFAVVTETVFAWPGMGKLLIDSINRLDRPVIVAYLMVIVLMFVVINLVVDMLYAAARSARAARRGEGLTRWRTVARRRRDARERRRAGAPCDAAKASCGATSREFLESRVAVVGLAVLVAARRARRARALDRAAEPLRPRAARHHGHRCRPARSRLTGIHLLARHRRPGPRHAVGDHLRPAHLALSSASSSAVIACAIGAVGRRARGLCRRPRRDADHAPRRPAARRSRRS